MPWVRAQFKDQEIWAEVDEAGRPRLVGGRRPIRYNASPAAKIYMATAGNVEDLGGDPIVVASPPRTDGAPVAARDGAVVAWTDGACTGNPGPAGSGVVVVLATGVRVERHRALGFATNNIAELTAVGMALEVLHEHAVERGAVVDLHTDSQYAIGVLTKGWKAKANVELVGALKARIREWTALDVHWVRGHTGVPDNERADLLARRGVEESRRGGR